MARRTLRLTDDLSRRISEATAERGFGSSASFIRAALENELARNDSAKALAALEERTSASIVRLSNEVQKVKNATQVGIALVDTLAKLLVTCLPEADSPAAISQGKERHRRYLRSAAASVKGDLLKTLQEIQ